MLGIFCYVFEQFNKNFNCFDVKVNSFVLALICLQVHCLQKCNAVFKSFFNTHIDFTETECCVVGSDLKCPLEFACLEFDALYDRSICA